MHKIKSLLRNFKRNTKVFYIKKDKNSQKWKKSCNHKSKNISKLIKRSLRTKIGPSKSYRKWSKTQKEKKRKLLKRTLKILSILSGVKKMSCKLKNIRIQSSWKCINTCFKKITVWKSSWLKYSQTKATKKQKETKKDPQFFTQIRVKLAHQSMLLPQIIKALRCKKERKPSQMRIKNHLCTWILQLYQTVNMNWNQCQCTNQKRTLKCQKKVK